MKVLAITRAERFSPNSVDKDRAILEAVTRRLQNRGCEVNIIGEDAVGTPESPESPECPECPESLEAPDLILTMGRRPETLAWLKTASAKVINSPTGIENCARNRLQTIMERLGTPIPPKEGTDGYWLKRGDAAAQESGDVVFAPDKEALAAAVRRMQQRGMSDYQVSAHVVGDLVKFYGVGQGRFFRYFYPTDDGETKFGDESHNGPAHHYPFQVERLRQEVERLAEAVGVSIYGGDAIIWANGSFCLIDFNDWPSFSRCREEAAEAIATLVIN